MSLDEEFYNLNGFKGRIFYSLHELLNIVEKNIFKFYKVKPAFLDAFRKNLLGENLIGVEIGVHRGYNAYSMLKYLNIKKLFLVDPYMDYIVRDKTFISNDSDYIHAMKLLKLFSDKIIFIKESSENAIDRIPDDLDFVYIDGNHNYDFVRRDVELYSKKLRVGGLLGFDDTNLYSVGKVIFETLCNSDFMPVDSCINCIIKIL